MKPEHFLVVIPVDPKASLPDTAGALRDALADIAGTNEARVKDYGKLQFIDAGQNATHIACPGCQSTLSQALWHAWMKEDWHGAEGFHLHMHDMPCCNRTVNLNDLVYDAPQGFAHWFVGARSGKRGPLSESELQELEKIADLGLKAIHQTY